MHYLRLTPLRAAGLTLIYVVLWWQAWVWKGGEAIRQLGLFGLFIIGVVWLVWVLERTTQRIEVRRLRELPQMARRVLVAGEAVQPDAFGTRSWNPLDPGAWYYGQQNQRLRQSLAVLTAYSLAFLLVHLILTNLGDAIDPNAPKPYELPAGGGGGRESSVPRAVRIHKVIAPKFVINPFSSILINVPPIDNINLKIMDDTRAEYSAGQGGGEGSGKGSGKGFGSGTGFGFGHGAGSGKLRFIRLKHSDSQWNKNFGIGGDMNLLNFVVKEGTDKKYVAEETESVEVTQLPRFPPLKAPPCVYVGGSKTFALTVSEQRMLRQYLFDQHGMILGDNLGGGGFHNQFIATLNAVTGVEAVMVPRDDPIHHMHYHVPELPIVVAHGGTAPLGWKVDGRWVAYYHPGALSDAWRDDHAGIKREIYEACFQLGVNILLYTHLEAEKWRGSKKP